MSIIAWNDCHLVASVVITKAQYKSDISSSDLIIIISDFEVQVIIEIINIDVFLFSDFAQQSETRSAYFNSGIK